VRQRKAATRITLPTHPSIAHLDNARKRHRQYRAAHSMASAASWRRLPQRATYQIITARCGSATLEWHLGALRSASARCAGITFALFMLPLFIARAAVSFCIIFASAIISTFTSEPSRIAQYLACSYRVMASASRLRAYLGWRVIATLAASALPRAVAHISGHGWRSSLPLPRSGVGSVIAAASAGVAPASRALRRPWTTIMPRALRLAASSRRCPLAPVCPTRFRVSRARARS